MALEIEHKYLVRSDEWRAGADDGRRMRQGYLANQEGLSIRVRAAGDDAWLNIKHAERLTVRHEYEYPIPIADAEELLDGACNRPLVEKTRYRVEHESHVWEVDVFHGDNEGLIVAEIELESEHEAYARPSWLGADVSDDPRYLNQNLSRQPYSRWRDDASGG